VVIKRRQGEVWYADVGTGGGEGASADEVGFTMDGVEGHPDHACV